MSKLVRLPLTLLAVLAALFFLPGIAWGDPAVPSAADCAADATLAGCPAPDSNHLVDQTLPGDQAIDPAQQPAGAKLAPPQNEQSPAGGSAARNADTPAGTAAAPLVTLDPPSFCDQLPTNPICTGTHPPTGPLTCDQLAALLGLTGGCPQNFSCADLADLLGITCPAGAPDCATLAALFHLEGCPQPPTSCQEFADLLGVDHCSDIPCIDTSQLPPQARDGLKPLLDGLKNIGIRECPVKPVGSTPPPGKGTTMPPAQAAAAPGVVYANCDDARAHGATNIPQGTPGYRPELDADHDGFACDEARPAAAPAATQPTGRLAFTGLELGPQLNLAWTLLVLGSGLLIVGRRRA